MSLKHKCCVAAEEYLSADSVRKRWYIPFWNEGYDNIPDEISVQYCPWCGVKLIVEDMKLVSDLCEKKELLESQGNFADAQTIEQVLKVLN
jgi:hypothetical protein